MPQYNKALIGAYHNSQRFYVIFSESQSMLTDRGDYITSLLVSFMSVYWDIWLK